MFIHQGRKKRQEGCERMETMRKYLFVINDAPYGNERPYNALRHAMNLARREDVQVKVSW